MANPSHQEFFKQLNAFFDKVYVVSIPRLAERQQHMRNLLDGLDYHMIEGTDKQKLSEQDISEQYDQKAHFKLTRTGKPLRAGEVACALSHLQVYQDAIAHGYDQILVLEDDISLVDDHLNEVAKHLDDLPNKWEFAYLGYWKNEVEPTLGWLKQGWYILLRLVGLHKWSIRRIRNIYPETTNSSLMKAGNHEGAYGYALTLGACKKLLAFNRPIKLNADNLFSHLITNEYLKGYLWNTKFVEPISHSGKGSFNSETNKN
ncbi:MAG: glycosyltransferase family 25 protein [Bacteroidota bacterium]